MKFREALETAKKLAKQYNHTYAIWENNGIIENYLVDPNTQKAPVTHCTCCTYSKLFLVTPSGTISQ